MLYLAIKAVVPGLIIAIVSEVSKWSPALGALVVSLPLVSILSILWLWNDTGDHERIASHMVSTVWYVLATLPMFLVVPALLRGGFGSWPSLGAGCILTIALYAITVWALAKAGIHL
jgi:hypothetical protein